MMSTLQPNVSRSKNLDFQMVTLKIKGLTRTNIVGKKLRK